MQSQLQQLIAFYESELNALLAVPDSVEAAQIVSILLNRDYIQHKLSKEAVSPSDLQRIVRLDQALKQHAELVGNAIAFQSLRSSYKPQTEHWWWHLDEQAAKGGNQLDSFECAIRQIDGRNSDTFLVTAIEAFIARDKVQSFLKNGQMNSSELLKLAELDHRLSQVFKSKYRKQKPTQKRNVVEGLEKARDILKPNQTAWWWFPNMPTSWLSYFDPIWTALTVVWTLAIFELMRDIATRLLGSGGTGTFGSLSIIFQGTLAIIGGGAVTKKGQAIANNMLSKWNMPKRFRRILIFAGATALLIVFLWFRASLPRTARRFNDSAINDYSVGNVNSAESKLKKAIELDPNYEVAHYNLGVIYQKLDRYEEAKAQYELAIIGSSIAAYNNQARLLILEEEYETAIKLLNQGISLAKKNDTDADPENDTSPIVEHDLWKNLGWAEFSRGDLSEAEDDLNRAISIAENSQEQEMEAAPHCLLAQTYEELEREDEAQAAWRSCLKYPKDPDNSEEYQWQQLAKRQLNV